MQLTCRKRKSLEMSFLLSMESLESYAGKSLMKVFKICHRVAEKSGAIHGSLENLLYLSARYTADLSMESLESCAGKY